MISSSLITETEEGTLFSGVAVLVALSLCVARYVPLFSSGLTAGGAAVTTISSSAAWQTPATSKAASESRNREVR